MASAEQRDPRYPFMDEQEDQPLKVEGIDVVSLPFYKLSTRFGDLDQSENLAVVV
ncbi:hypothetical protein ACNKHM_05015 [Shigella sonnei]